MGKKETEVVDDKFDVLAEITEMDVDEDEKTRLAEKAERKRLRKEMTKEEKEAQRKINRENREKKKAKKELNKKRKVMMSCLLHTTHTRSAHLFVIYRKES